MPGKRQAASSARLMALNSMWQMACNSAARPSRVKGLREGTSLAGTNRGRAGRPGMAACWASSSVSTACRSGSDKPGVTRLWGLVASSPGSSPAGACANSARACRALRAGSPSSKASRARWRRLLAATGGLMPRLSQHAARLGSIRVPAHPAHLGCHQGRDAKKEAVGGGRLARQAHQHAANDGGARAAGARDHRQALDQANLDGVDEAKVVNGLDAGLGLARRDALGDQDDHATDDEGGGNHRWREQVLLDHLADQQAHDDRWQEADDHIEGETLRLRVGAQAGDRVLESLKVDQDDGEDGAGLDGNFEDFGLFGAGGLREAHHRVGQDEVACAGDGQELGQPLDDAHQRGLEEQHQIQSDLLNKTKPAASRRCSASWGRDIRTHAPSRPRDRGACLHSATCPCPPLTLPSMPAGTRPLKTGRTGTPQSANVPAPSSTCRWAPSCKASPCPPCSGWLAATRSPPNWAGPPTGPMSRPCKCLAATASGRAWRPWPRSTRATSSAPGPGNWVTAGPCCWARSTPRWARAKFSSRALDRRRIRAAAMAEPCCAPRSANSCAPRRCTAWASRPPARSPLWPRPSACVAKPSRRPPSSPVWRRASSASGISSTSRTVASHATTRCSRPCWTLSSPITFRSWLSSLGAPWPCWTRWCAAPPGSWPTGRPRAFATGS